MKHFFIIIAFSLSFIIHAQKRHFCPSIKHNITQSKLLNSMKMVTRNSNARTTNDDVLKIPVVFHVLHNSSESIGNGKNISNAQIYSQIDVLNNDFRRLNSDSINTPTSYASIASDTKIEFVLASEDTSSNPTTGIIRVITSEASFEVRTIRGFLGPEYDHMKSSTTNGSDPWNTSKYLNIWVCKMEHDVLGYAQFPPSYYSLPDLSKDGVVLDYRFIGTTGTATAPFNLGRTLTHEVGHYLGLFHTWGDGNCSADDGINDTPLCDSTYFSSFSSCLAPTQCGNRRMIENYMDYSDDGCMNLFTNGQTEYMRYELVNPSGSRLELTNDSLVTITYNNSKLDLSELIYSYPNPVSDIIFIESEKNITLEQVTILNSSGVIIGEFENFTNQINVSSIPQGSYFIKYTTNLGSYYDKLFILR